MFQGLRLIVFGLVCGCWTTSGAAEGKLQERPVVTLTDTESNKRTETMSISRADFGGSFPDTQPPWSIEKTTLHGGRQEGCELVTIDNGVLKIVVVPTRGMSVLRVSKSARPGAPADAELVLGWNSPVKEVVHPQFINLQSRGGLGWLEGFNEWMVRCGLESAGHPGKDEFINNVGDKVDMDLSLHGKIGNLPASKVTVSVDREPPFRIRLAGTVNERMFYGPKLELITEISTTPGATTFRIRDQLLNHGAGDQEYQLIYHTNFGPPFLEKGARTVVAAEKIEPMNGHAAKSIESFSVYEAPTPGFVEQVYLIHPKSDATGKSQALLTNAAGNRGVSVAWQTSELPYFTIWKNTAATADGYVTGLEPGTGFPFNRNVERKFGRVPTLGAGQSRTFQLDYSLHEDAAAVDKVEAMIIQLQGGPPQLAAEPPAIPDP